MRILLLNSPWINTRTEYGIKSGTRWAAIRKKERTMPYFPYPYFMASASAVLKAAGLEAHVKDAINEEMGREACLAYLEDLQPDVVVIEPYTPSIYVDLEFAAQVKARCETRVAFCGAHATALPRDMLESPDVDFVLLGEYEYTLRELGLLLKSGSAAFSTIAGLAYKNGSEIQINPKRPPIENLDELPFPDFDQLPPSRYNEPLSRHNHVKLVGSRGCPYNCIFCVEPLLFHRIYRQHSVEYLLRLIRHARQGYGVREVYFDDDIFTIQRAKEIAQALIDADLVMPWSCWMHWNISRDDLRLLKQSGCFAIKFGVESANEQVLRQANKTGVDIANIRRLVRDCKSLGVLAHGSFILGLPGETRQSLRETVDLAFSLDLDACQFSIATPLPGTPFYHLAKKNHWLVTEDWSQFEGLESCVVSYPECSREDILAAMEEVRQKKVRQFLKDPRKAIFYIWKLTRVTGFSGLLQALVQKGRFAVKALWPR